MYFKLFENTTSILRLTRYISRDDMGPIEFKIMQSTWRITPRWIWLSHIGIANIDSNTQISHRSKWYNSVLRLNYYIGTRNVERCWIIDSCRWLVYKTLYCRRSCQNHWLYSLQNDCIIIYLSNIISDVGNRPMLWPGHGWPTMFHGDNMTFNNYLNIAIVGVM